MSFALSLVSESINMSYCYYLVHLFSFIFCLDNRATLLCLCMLLAIGITATTTNHVSEANIEVIFYDNSIFNEYEMNPVINSFQGGEHIQTYGLLCTLFGHDYKMERVFTIEHKVYKAAPSCLVYAQNVQTQYQNKLVKYRYIVVTKIFSRNMSQNRISTIIYMRENEINT